MIRDSRLRSLFFYLLGACLTAVYWGIAGWACHTATGYDPLDLMTVSEIDGGSIAAGTAVMAAFVVIYAVAGYRFERWRVARRLANG